MLTNPYLIAIGIPLLLILSGGFAKKLVRGSSWESKDFFLGVELCLSALAAALVFVFDLAKLTSAQSSTVSSVMQSMVATASFLALSFFLLLWILSIHQDWERRSQNPKGQLLWLGIISNLIGAGLITAFVLLVKGV